MEPHGRSGPTELQNLRLDVLRRAVDIYLGIAYPTGAIPDVVGRRLEWSSDVEPASLLAQAPFERVTKAGTASAQIYALRLGNTRYPHMKLQIQPWPNECGFMLSVNTHDQVLALDPSANDAPAFRELQAENQRLKEAIECAWEKSGLPTFLNYLRSYIERRTGSGDAEGSPADGTNAGGQPGPA